MLRRDGKGFVCFLVFVVIVGGGGGGKRGENGLEKKKGEVSREDATS